MGLIDKARETKPALRTSGGLLHRSLGRQPGPGPIDGLAATVPPSDPERPAAVPAPVTESPPAPARRAAASPLDDLSSQIAHIESGIDSAPLLFEILARAMALQSAALYLADYARGSLVPCASRGINAVQPIEVTAPVERFFADPKARPLDAGASRTLGIADGKQPHTWAKPFTSTDVPAGLLVFSQTAQPLSDEALRNVLDNPEIATLLGASTEHLGGFPPPSLESLENVTPAGPSMLLTVSCDDMLATLRTLAPSINTSWLTDSIQRVLAALLAPLGRVGVRTGLIIALLTGRSVDTDLLTHQVSLRLARSFRSVRHPRGALVKIA
jgi:hypothetical protein